MNARESFERADRYMAEEPTPLLRAIPPGEPYPVECLGPLREAAEAIHDMTQAPPAIPAQSVLGVAALATQGLADAETLDGRAPASLYLLTIAQSGERKSSCDKRAMSAVRDFEAELGEAERAEAVEWRNRLDVWEAQRKDILAKAKKDGAAAKAALDALGPQPEAPFYPTVTVAEPTLEGLVKHLARFRPSLGLFSDEGGAFLGGHGMNAENKLKTVAGLSGFWDGSAAQRIRAGDGVSVYRGRRLSAHLMAQPVAAAGLLADPIANGQGFLARFLIAEPPSAIGTRLRLGHSPASERALARFGERAAALLRQPLPFAEGRRSELAPPLLPLSPEARTVLRDFYLAAEAAQIAGGDLESVRPFASKATEQAARLAAVMTLFGDPAARIVSAETMADATTLAGFYLGEAGRLANAATISQATTEAEALRVWLLKSWAEPFVSVRAVVNRGPNSLRETAKARAALKALEAHGWIACEAAGATVLGVRAKEAWRINREGQR